MKAMILAAGRGERMRPLTDTTPKPLLEVKGKPLIFYHLEKLANSDIKECVINVAHLSQKIIHTVGNGKKFGLKIDYSTELQGGLETGGGIYHALAKLGKEPFIVINADIYTDYDFARLHLATDKLAHLILAPNPEHNPNGDFSLSNQLITPLNPPHRYTFTGIAIYHPHFFSDCAPGKFRLGPLLHQFALDNLISGELYKGMWYDVGTVSRLDWLNSLCQI